MAGGDGPPELVTKDTMKDFFVSSKHPEKEYPSNLAALENSMPDRAQRQRIFDTSSTKLRRQLAQKYG